MKRPGWMILIAIALFAALPLAADETVAQCITNCPPGNQSCTQCCMAQYDAASPCTRACADTFDACILSAAKACPGGGLMSPCFARAMTLCAKAYHGCLRACEGSVRIAGGCPGEVPPQKCPYDCQMWNPASQSCVGVAMNGCGQMMVSAQLQQAALDEIMAARAKDAAAAAAAHLEKLEAEAKKGKGKKKSSQ